MYLCMFISQKSPEKIHRNPMKKAECPLSSHWNCHVPMVLCWIFEVGILNLKLNQRFRHLTCADCPISVVWAWVGLTYYIILHYIMLCYIILCYIMLCYIILYYVMLCYIMLCYIILCYVMLYYIILYYIILYYIYIACTTYTCIGCSRVPPIRYFLVITSEQLQNNLVD